jgi:hypothetical protein
MKRALIYAALCLSLLYLGDYILVRYRIAKNGEPFGVVKVQRYYAVRKKDRKTEFIFDQPETESCVRSLFPHFGQLPCWYANRRNVKRINL